MTSPANAAGVGRDGVAAARLLASWLALAATPTFAVMAVLAAMRGGEQAELLCSAGQGSVLAGMVPMYVLMSAFHAAAWLRWIAPQRAAGRAVPPE